MLTFIIGCNAPNGSTGAQTEFAIGGSFAATSLTRLARLMVNDGEPDQPWQAFHNGKPSLSGPSLHGLAAIIGGGASWSTYIPDPGEHVSAALAAAIARRPKGRHPVP